MNLWLRGLKCHNLHKETREVIFDFRIIFQQWLLFFMWEEKNNKVVAAYI